MSQNVLRLAPLEKKKVERAGGDQKNLLFSPADKKNHSTAINFCSLEEDGVYSMIPNFEEN